MGDYLILSEVKEQLGDLGTDYDTFLGKLITRASRDVDRLTRQFFDLKAGVNQISLPVLAPATITVAPVRGIC